MSHKHDELGPVNTTTIVVGNELVTMDQHTCSCGKVTRTVIAGREKMK